MCRRTSIPTASWCPRPAGKEGEVEGPGEGVRFGRIERWSSRRYEVDFLLAVAVSRAPASTPEGVPSPQPIQAPIAHRDLFDAYFHPISPDDLIDDSALQRLDAPSGLVPEVYEGGLKTWESSLGTVDYVASTPRRFGGNGFSRLGAG
ncbi:hypothetical protein JAAARDRAFT_200965 [Jaapia argillacea MUCL 33604]|uniref:Uncharacterized protein n=1 Tax=Jaapia argillacea MUCL 33604 TaxID=933084 RepID=A0A067P3I0_9AGAM|nr:hypothetical protein JAAARDRAFT_200965 [Jaapia argillacea MUCL 33604]